MKKFTFLISGVLIGLLVQSQNLNLNDENWFSNGSYFAYVQSLAMAPSNPDVVYLGTYSAGLYKTINGGGIREGSGGNSTLYLIDGLISDVDFAALVNPIPANKKVFWMQQYVF